MSNVYVASMRVALSACLVVTTLGIDNGIGLTPPQGWRSWNCYGCTDSDACAKTPSTCNMATNNVLTESKMKLAMHGVLDKSRKLKNGTVACLADLGYNWVSMDDGWQGCNCSTHQMIDNSLPQCSIGDCRGGKCSWHDPTTGKPRVKGEDPTKPESNTNRFPHGMKALVDYGHSLGLKVGGYLNNCICMEAHGAQPHYEQDVEWLVHDVGFDGVKIDNCGTSHNVTYYAELFNQTGKAIRIEDCHTSPVHPSVDKDGNIFCPMNMYRAGGDIKPNFGSIIAEIMSTIKWNNLTIPLSRPGCWAYPDMMQIGNFNGVEPIRTHEEQAHFGLWSINSAPLVLGFDLGDTTRVDRVWPIITNTDALSVNQQWAGHPGTLIRSWQSTGDTLGIQLWSKPLPNGKVAVLVLNTMDTQQTMTIRCSDVPGQPCCKTDCAVRDVWAQEDIGDKKDLAITLATHQTAYYVLTPSEEVVSV